jgi:hypothetical protein
MMRSFLVRLARTAFTVIATVCGVVVLLALCTVFVGDRRPDQRLYLADPHLTAAILRAPE